MTEQVTAIDRELATMRGELSTVGAAVKSLLAEVQRLKTDDRVLTEMHDRCRHLSESFHEREVLLPFFRCLIGIADRCVQEADRAERQMKQATCKRSWAHATALGYVLEARNADRIEIENLLANFGVEPFEHDADRFDARVQRCLRRIECRDPESYQTIARRLRPGYRRNGTVVRPECVAVFVPANSHSTSGAQ